MVRWLPIAWLALGALLLAQAQAARACSLDGIASISANGHTASLTGGVPTAASIAHWAQFTLLSAAPGDALQLEEDLGKIWRTLPGPAFAHPFRWAFGDGAQQEGTSVTHRYTRLGWYKIAVSYYWPPQHRWVLFDSAQLQIVPKGDLWKANLGYYVGQAFLLAMRVTIWTTIAVLIGCFIWLRLRPALRRARHNSGTGPGRT